MDKPKLLDQVRNLIRVRHMSRRTAEAYAYWIKRFILFHGKRHPAELGAQEIGEYTIANHLYFGEHGHPEDPTCEFDNEEVIETTVSIPNGQSQDIDAFRFHIADTEVSFHDTSLFIRLNPLVSGTGAAARVFPNSDGTALCERPEP